MLARPNILGNESMFLRVNTESGYYSRLALNFHNKLAQIKIIGLHIKYQILDFNGLLKYLVKR